MRPFKFSLQRVLDVRQVFEDRERQLLAAAVAETRRAADTLATAQRQLAAAVDADRTETSVVDPALRSIGWRRRAYLRRQVSESKAILAQATEQEREARARLVVRRRERRVMEMLAEKHRAEHNVQMRRAEQAVLDDLATMRHGKTRAGVTGE